MAVACFRCPTRCWASWLEFNEPIQQAKRMNFVAEQINDENLNWMKGRKKKNAKSVSFFLCASALTGLNAVKFLLSPNIKWYLIDHRNKRSRDSIFFLQLFHVDVWPETKCCLRQNDIAEMRINDCWVILDWSAFDASPKFNIVRIFKIVTNLQVNQAIFDRRESAKK